MTASVKIVRMDDPALGEDGGLAATEKHTVYEGKARVYGVSGPMTMNLGEEPQYFSSTYVSIPYDAVLPRVDDVITVTAHHDWTLVGRTFRVMDVEAGGQYPAVRRMQVTGVQNSKAWVQVGQSQGRASGHVDPEGVGAMSNLMKLTADLKQLQAQGNQIKAAGEMAMKQAAPGGKGFTVGPPAAPHPDARAQPADRHQDGPEGDAQGVPPGGRQVIDHGALTDVIL